LQINDISKVQRNSGLGADATDVRRRLLVENWEFFPTMFGGYIQDKMEYAGLIINLGARLDRWDPKAADWASYYNLFVLTNNYPVDDSLRSEIVPLRGKDNVAPYWFFSPRIGVSHPISDEAAMYFSYSRNFIPPSYSRLYGSYNAVLGAAGGLPQFASLRQEPTKSSNYELGAQWEFVPKKFGLSFAAYMRDIENYTQQGVTLQLANGANSMWISSQYADARGVELGLQALRQTYFDFLTLYGRLNYTYSYIKATGWAGLDATQQTTFSRPDTLKYGNILPFNDFWAYNKV
jgi:outer membrane receptor protein involved in Fe transport